MPAQYRFSGGEPHPSEVLSIDEWQAYAEELTGREIKHGFEGDIRDYCEPVEVIGNRLLNIAIRNDLHELYSLPDDTYEEESQSLPGDTLQEDRMQTVMRLLGAVMVRFGVGMGYGGGYLNKSASNKKCSRPRD